MEVYFLDITCTIGNGQPTQQEAEQYVRETWRGFVKDDTTGELWPNEIFVMCHKLRANIRIGTKESRKANARRGLPALPLPETS